ncbi:MAG TPA: class I SAM-dependent methyltransferase [Solirubrobacteraceae bacterium]|jgi:O-methyltransferase involved in polyketide biosynthesis|nr:class I SAM-dependent methyltransferase [Solirubrobacteraceae bacterium]
MKMPAADDSPHGSEAISPTAHYTGYVWARNGLSHPVLITREGRVLYEAMRPLLTISGVLGAPTLESYLLARHRAIDALLERAIEDGRVSQVIEVACGLSPRGWRFAERHRDRITYIEADLPGMAARKRRALVRIGSLGEHHRVEAIDALRDLGPGSLAQIAGTFEPDRGLAIITEGLLGYLDRATVEAVWRRFARELAGFPDGCYLSDLPLGGRTSAVVRAFGLGLSAFVRGQVHLHFAGAAEATDALHGAGFARAAVRPAAEILNRPDTDSGARFAHVIKADVR